MTAPHPSISSAITAATHDMASAGTDTDMFGPAPANPEKHTDEGNLFECNHACR